MNNQPLENRPNDGLGAAGAQSQGRSRDTATRPTSQAEPVAPAVCSAALLGVDLIRAERLRQMDREGWAAEHDDAHTGGELATAAACYACPESKRADGVRGHLKYDAIDVPDTITWPWEEAAWKPSPQDRIRDLVKSGALIAAEIDRLLRKRSETLNAKLCHKAD